VHAPELCRGRRAVRHHLRWLRQHRELRHLPERPDLHRIH